MKRDLSRAQFEAKDRALGCTPEGFMGYWQLPTPIVGASRTSVSVLNAGNRRRDWLKYLKREIKRIQSA